ncbi:MAG: hypothetical protein AAF184_10970 [Pseudomonadota bacterium]
MRLSLTFAAAIGALALAPGALGAPATFANPFADGQTVLAERGAAADATTTLVYATEKNDEAGPQVTLRLGPDWASVETDGESTIGLYDYATGRIFSIDGTGIRFGSLPLSAGVAARVQERQNRDFLSNGLGTFIPNVARRCDQDAELGVSVPPDTPDPMVSVARDDGVITVICEDTTLARLRFRPGTVPASFASTVSSMVALHPKASEALITANELPELIETEYRDLAGQVTHRHRWTLLSREEARSSYPLRSTMRSQTLSDLTDAIGETLAQVALDAVNGSADSEPPDIASVTGELDALLADDRADEAAMLFMARVAQVPALMEQCATSTEGICRALAPLRTRADGGVAATYMQIITAEQTNQGLDAAISASAAIKDAPGVASPAFQQSLALALVRGGREAIDQARGTGLPHDPIAMMRQNLKAQPYHPGFWVDLSDRYTEDYDTATAYRLIEVAWSLPVPGARAPDTPQVGRERFAQRLRADFPAFFGPAP